MGQNGDRRPWIAEFQAFHLSLVLNVYGKEYFSILKKQSPSPAS